MIYVTNGGSLITQSMIILLETHTQWKTQTQRKSLKIMYSLIKSQLFQSSTFLSQMILNRWAPCQNLRKWMMNLMNLLQVILSKEFFIVAENTRSIKNFRKMIQKNFKQQFKNCYIKIKVLSLNKKSYWFIT